MRLPRLYHPESNPHSPALCEDRSWQQDDVFASRCNCEKPVYFTEFVNGSTSRLKVFHRHITCSLLYCSYYLFDRFLLRRDNHVANMLAAIVEEFGF